MDVARLPLAHRLPAPVAYVLGGGGAYGAVQMGMLRALALSDLRPDLVVGTSVGSINGAIVAADPGRAAAALAELWPQIDRKQVFPGRVITHAIATAGGRPYLFDPGPLAELLAAYLPVASVEELAVPFTAVATDLDTGEIVLIDEGDLRQALLASSAIPGVFPWVERDGRRLVDGGLGAMVPVRQAVDLGAASVVVLDCGQYRPSSRRPDGLLDVLVQSLAIAARQQVTSDLAVAENLPVVYLPAPHAIRSTLFDFAHTGPLADSAYADAVPMLAALAAAGDGPLDPGLYGDPPVAAAHPAVAELRRA